MNMNENADAYRKKTSHNQLVQRALSDPAIRALVPETPLASRRRELYAESAQGVIADLAQVGFPVGSEVGELRRSGVTYVNAVPVLIEWLPRVSYLLLVEDIVRTLSVPFAKKQALPVFLAMFQEPPHLEDPLRPETSEPASEHIRWVVGNGLGIFADPANADDMIRLARDRSYGKARTQIVAALPKTKSQLVPEVLMELLDDPTVVAFAIEALGKMKIESAKAPIERLINSPDENVRVQAKKALKRLA